MLTYITIMTVTRSLLTEVIQQDTPTTHVSFSILAHAAQTLHINFTLTARLSKSCKLHNICNIIEQKCISRSAIASCPTYLLIVIFNTFW